MLYKITSCKRKTVKWVGYRAREYQTQVGKSDKRKSIGNIAKTIGKKKKEDLCMAKA